MTRRGGNVDAGVALSVATGVATLTLERPPTGLLDAAAVAAVGEHVQAVVADPDVRVLVLRSLVPGFFACHYDLREVLAFDKSAEAPDELKPYHRLCETLRTSSTVTVAVIEGRAGGGGAEIALSCDLRYASPAAVFNQPEVGMGIIPGGSGTVRLPRLVGRSRALEVVLGCDDVDALTAERWGLVNRCLDADRLWPFVERLARRIASFPAHAVTAAKDAVLGGDVGAQEVTEHLLHEALRFRQTLADPRAAERMERFLDRGGQSVANESRLGSFLGELGDEEAEQAGREER